MRKLFSTNHSAGAFNLAMLVLRLTVGGLMAWSAGYFKFTHFDMILNGNPGGSPPMLPFSVNFLGLGYSVSLSLLVFAELFCASLLVLGLFTRLAAIPLIISSSVALFTVHHGHIFSDGQMITLFLCGYIVLLLTGPGKISVDGLISK